MLVGRQTIPQLTGRLQLSLFQNLFHHLGVVVGAKDCVQLLLGRASQDALGALSARMKDLECVYDVGQRDGLVTRLPFVVLIPIDDDLKQVRRGRLMLQV